MVALLPGGQFRTRAAPIFLVHDHDNDDGKRTIDGTLEKFLRLYEDRRSPDAPLFRKRRLGLNLRYAIAVEHGLALVPNRRPTSGVPSL